MSESKDVQILRMLTEAAGQGIASRELQAAMQTTRKGACASIWRLRQQGHEIKFRREEGGRARFFLAEHFPGSWVRPKREPRPAIVADVAQRLRELVNRPEGACRLDIVLTMCSSRRAAARKELARMIEAGEAAEYFNPRPVGRPMVRLFAGKPPEGWFTAAELIQRRKAKTAKPPKPEKQPKPKSSKKATTIQRSAKPWTPPEPKQLPPAIIPPTVKVQVLPSVQIDVRYQVDPRTRVVGGFATMGAGRYLEGQAA